MPEKRVVIFSGPVHTGKTTRLLHWSGLQTSVAGILSPVLDGKRCFMNIRTGEYFPMEFPLDDSDIYEVGRYRFSKKAFDQAASVIREGLDGPGWLLIDEIGPLELKGEGFYHLLREIIPVLKKKLLLVVRDGLVEKVCHEFGIVAESVTNLDPL